MSTPGRWGRFRYTPNLPLYEGRARVTDSPEHQQLSEQAAAEGIVLLKNDGLLPLAAGARVALFGKATFDYVKGGGGSGDVTVSGTVNLYDALKALPDRITVSEATIPFYREYVEKQRAQGLLAGCIAEPALPAQLIKLAAAEADTAILSISRYSGEGWDRKMDDRSKVEYTEFTKAEFQAAGLFDRGDFYLSASERKLVSQLKKTFKSVVVLLNVGSIVDTAWFAQDPVFRAAMLIGQGGMRGAAAAAKALTGLVNPSGRLIDTWAANIADYPSTEGFFASDDYVEYTEDIYVGYRYFSTIPGAA
ncbi:MAG: glycoside hydrolase family 3 C-terminal domain-containing protein, partial [Lachnospiraceae bacterium]|nr:glycoside hydrolase family 3 C-terminal domain-containing protein [Lachnospiraceae bacterium]